MFEQILNEKCVLTFFFIFLRISSIFFTLPVFSNKAIKPTLRIVFSIIVAIVTYGAVVPVEFNGDIPLLLLIIKIVKEILLGIAIGTLTSALFTGVTIGGYLIDFQIGFSMVNVIDPNTGDQFSFMSSVINIIVMLIFISIGGPGMLIAAIAYSFEIIPIGDFNINDIALLYPVKIFMQVFIISITLAAPPLIALTATNAVMGVLGKLIPQINLMVVGFPIKIVVGIVTFLTSLTFFYIAFEKIAYNYFLYLKHFMILTKS